MGGGLMQLVAYGAQDIYLTGNPQITFFKVVYRRHTNFSMEAILQTFNGTVGTGQSTVTATISRNGDLVSNLWLDVKLTTGGAFTGQAGQTYSNWTNNTGHAFVKDCEIEIGGQRIDRHYSQWLDVYNELTDHEEQEWLGLNKHAAKNSYLKSNKTLDPNPSANGQRLYVPLKFWFCRNPGLALPLIALQYHEVKLKLNTRGLLDLFNADGTGAAAAHASADVSVDLYADYIYLDTDERRRFAQVSHEYLIEQVQRETGTMSTSQTLKFNHPIKELIWVVQDSTCATSGDNTIDASGNLSDNNAAVGNNDYFNYGAGANRSAEDIGGATSYEAFTDMKLQLNGHDRFSKRNASYFRTCQPIQAGHKVPSKHVYCYSFALKPEEHQPSGTCNFSRIDDAQMIFTLDSSNEHDLSVYAVNYNVLRIMSGMGGLAYSN